MSERDVKKITDAIGEIDDGLIAEAAKPYRRVGYFKHVAVAAACVAIVIAAVLFMPKGVGDAVGGADAPNSGENMAPDGTVQEPEAPGDSSDDGGDSGYPDCETGAGISAELISAENGVIKLSVSVKLPMEKIHLTLTASDGERVYTVTTDGNSEGDTLLGRGVLTVDGEMADGIPGEVGEYTVVYDVSDAILGLEELDWVLSVGGCEMPISR